MSCHVKNSRTLTSLHTEVLSRILMHIENSDIPAVMLTCKTLCSVIMTRHFWYDRIRRLCKEHPVSPPEEKLEEYTIAELERWTLRRLPVRCTLPTKLQCRSRDLESIHTPSYMELIPGGRWLLSLPPEDPRVYFVDLDSNDLQQHLLFDPRNVDPQFNHDSRLKKKIWIDHKAPRLSFRCAIYLLDGGDYNRGSARVQIHQVDLIGHGADATLVARIIATFRTPEKSAVTSCGFNDRYFVQGRKWGILEESESYDYRPALGCLDYPQIKCHHSEACILGDVSSALDFINEDVFAVHGSIKYHIFSIESPTSIIQLHTINPYFVQLDHSRIYWTPEASIITRIDEPLYKRDFDIITIHGIVIPHNRALSPWSIELCRLVRRHHTVLGLGILISVVGDQTGKISRVGHEWDFESQDSNPAEVSILENKADELEHRADELQELVGFDEDTGRVVRSGGKKLNIVDIVMAG